MHIPSGSTTCAPRRRAPCIALALVGLWLCMPAAVLADEVVLYRCTGAEGGLTVQNAPCPAGAQQRIQRFTAPATRVPPAAASTVPTAPVAAAVSTTGMLDPARLPVLQAGDVQTSVDAEDTAILDSDVVRRQTREQANAAAEAKPPLPEIYQCQGNEGGSYLHEREPAPPHCVLMTVSGLGGNTPVNAAGCEVIRDACTPIAEAQRCSSWQQRFRDARGRERFAAPENQVLAAAERERLQSLLANSDCPVPD
ncbi:hypothetical protein KQ945_12990 [Bacillus subtilis subsp. subtilis]|nr:hypothetical protein [Bacillus subtilis subsp. subtilis]